MGSENAPTDKFTSFLLSELPNIKSGKLSNVQTILHSALKLVQPATCPVLKRLRKAFATIHEPAKVSDNPVKFTAGLTTAVLLIADIENVVQVENIRIQVRFSV